MNRHEFEANWMQLKGAIPAKWGKFTMDDMNKFDGKYDPFLGHLQKKYGYSREQAETEMKNWAYSPKVESIAPAACSSKCNDKKEKKRKTG